MKFRPVLIAFGIAGAALAPASAFARAPDESATESQAAEMAKKLSDPQMQMAAAATLAAMAQAVLDMDIAPFTRAIDAAGGGGAVRDLPQDAKLRDLAGPEAERMPQDIARNVPRVMGSAAGMAGALEDMMPQLRETARQLKRAIPNY